MGRDRVHRMDQSKVPSKGHRRDLRRAVDRAGHMDPHKEHHKEHHKELQKRRKCCYIIINVLLQYSDKNIIIFYLHKEVYTVEYTEVSTDQSKDQYMVEYMDRHRELRKQ